ncbi:MAG: bifunctional enoyl-CoA hydratase/phosphate acetyltransferase [Geminicoccaceae bacterium]
MTRNGEMLENRTFDEIVLGDHAELTKTLSTHDIELFAAASGDLNPTHLDAEYASGTRFKSVIAHGMWCGGLISTLLGTKLPGPGTVYLGQDLRFHAPVAVGDTLTVSVSAIEKRTEDNIVLFKCLVKNQDDKDVVTGTAEIAAPREKLQLEAKSLPEISFRRHAKYDQLIQANKAIPPIICSVCHPCEETALQGAVEAAMEGIIDPILIGPRVRIETLAEELGLDLSPYEIIDTPHSHASAAKAVEIVRTGRAQLLMKGSLHTDEIMREVVAKDTGLRTARRISQVYLMDVPTYPEPLLITDGAINIAPDLETKADILQNAIDLHIGLGLGEPRVAILSAVETINPKMPGTLDAAALCKMTDRGQIKGAVVDGPLALDNAISSEAASIKGIKSPVAGRAQILLVPDLEAGNMLAKNLTFMASADAAGIVLGAKVPMILTSRSDGARTRIASAAVAALYAHYLAQKQPVRS